MKFRFSSIQLLVNFCLDSMPNELASYSNQNPLDPSVFHTSRQWLSTSTFFEVAMFIILQHIKMQTVIWCSPPSHLVIPDGQVLSPHLYDIHIQLLPEDRLIFLLQWLTFHTMLKKLSLFFIPTQDN